MKRVRRSDLLLLIPILPAIGSLLTIASCKPAENKPAPETQETSAADANAAKAVKDFGPTLLTIASQYSISHSDSYNSLLSVIGDLHRSLSICKRGHGFIARIRRCLKQRHRDNTREKMKQFA